ncbi:MAG: hypothetical protein GY913_15565 [Proteobacteria bacterium]|nr:hypothetical protein [Pseudomonadota bacterium]MCP4918327.1 hypothetical protein [Pseudomonadota bacterium]
MIALALALALGAALAAPPTKIQPDRDWDVLTPGDGRTMLAEAGEKLGTWELELAGLPVDGARLTAISQSQDPEILRALREDTGRPFDLTDLLLFVDDVLAQGEPGQEVVVPSGRLRSAGILIHPDEIWKGTTRRYGTKAVSIDRPEPPATYEPAVDGDVLGPEWSARYPNPEDRPTQLRLLAEERPNSDFSDRIGQLVSELDAQGAEVYITSTIRSRHRGYLMWGAFILSRATTEAQVEQKLALLATRDQEWGLATPITWRHPDGWEATIESARRMADAYDVVYATEKGARSSNHYDGTAADLVVLAMPREVTLTAPDGSSHTFDLSDPSETRDLSISKDMVEWVERHYGFVKLKSDYPHWDDATR